MAKVYIHGEIGESWFGESVSFKSFKKDFDAALKQTEGSKETIDVHINSIGGSVYDGIAIYNEIKNCGREITTIIDGIAYSMGAIIALAGTTVKAAKNSTILLHNCWGWSIGNVSDMQQSIEHMTALDANLIGTVAEKTGLSEDEVKSKWFDYKDHTLTATDAKEQGLIDELLGEAKNVPTGSYEEILASFRAGKKDNKGLMDKMTKLVQDAAAKLNLKAQSPKNDIHTMNIDEQLDLLASAEASADDKAAARKAIKDSYGAEEVFTKDEVDAKVTDAVSTAEKAKDEEIKGLKGQVSTLEAKVAANPTPQGGGADTVSGELTPEQQLEAMGKADYDAVKKDY